MKKLSIQTFFKTSSVLVVTLLMLFSCKKEPYLTSNALSPVATASPIQFDLNEAVNYFNQNALYKGERQDAELFSPIIAFQPEPLWDLATQGAFQVATGEYAFIEVPLKCQKGGLGVANWDSERELNGNVPKLDALNHFRLVIIKDKNGVLDGKFMIATPTKQYAQSKLGLSEMSNCSFDRPALDFDGGTVYFGLDGKYWKGWSYAKGKQTEEVSQVKKSALQIRDMYCSWMATSYSYTITFTWNGVDYPSTHTDFFWTYRCVLTASRDFAPWVWNRMPEVTSSLPTITATSVRSLFPEQRICLESFNFFSNSASGIPSSQMEALFKNFDINFRINGVDIPVHINYASLLYNNTVTPRQASDFFQARMNDTQNAIDNGAIATDLTPLAKKSAIRALFFTTYNDVAFNTMGNLGIGPMSYYLEDWRAGSYRVPSTCP
jgi:hypothetical protein